MQERESPELLCCRAQLRGALEFHSIMQSDWPKRKQKFLRHRNRFLARVRRRYFRRHQWQAEIRLRSQANVALAVRPIRNNTFEINWYVALLPNPVDSMAKTSLPRHTILWMHSIFARLWELCEQNSQEKHLPPFSLIGSKSTNHSPIGWRRKGYKVTLEAVIGEFRSRLSITRKTDGNFVLF